MPDDTEPMQPVEAFLRELGNSLLEGDDVDADVVTVLREHILVPDPSEDAVRHAADALIQLAHQRADSLDEGGC